MKTLGNLAWSGSLPTMSQANLTSQATTEISSEFSLALLREIFNPIVFRGLLGFMVWWLCSAWFTTSVVGFVYHSYFS